MSISDVLLVIRGQRGRKVWSVSNELVNSNITDKDPGVETTM